MSPGRTRSWNVPHVPIRTNVVAPTRASSSIAIAVDGQPIPVEVHEIGTPLYVPVNVTYSRLLATSWDSSHRLATSGTRPGSPGSSTYGATSPGESLRWYWRLTRRCVPRRPRGRFPSRWRVVSSEPFSVDSCGETSGSDKTMRGAVMHAPGDVRVEQRPDPKIVEPTDATIRLAATCICGSDLWPYRGVEVFEWPQPMGQSTPVSSNRSGERSRR